MTGSGENTMKNAIILFNLGGPDSKEAIGPFLKNFFMDPAIIRLPRPARDLVSSLIANRRSRREAARAYAALGYCSPLLANTEAQARALESALARTGEEAEWKVFVSMRYWTPQAGAVAEAVRDWRPDRIVLLPLYPQYSTTTTGSSFADWDRAARRAGLDVPCVRLCCYPQNPGFVAAAATAIAEQHAQFVREHPQQKIRVLFSAHGLPENIIAGGDPYQWQCEESAAAIAAATGIAGLDWQICYQSRVGRLKWIGPSTTEALEKAAADRTAVLVYPHAFVSEHVETLVEIEQDYREQAEKLGVPGFVRVPTAGVAAAFIDGLARMVADNISRTGQIVGPVLGACPGRFGRCCRRDSRPL